jgi:hypothetical protein
MTTEKQEAYIKALTSEYATRDEDRECYENFMQHLGRTSLKGLNNQEASDLIQELLKIEVPLTMLCGKVIMVQKDELMRGKVMGRLDECMHHCEIDVYDCEHWNKNDTDEIFEGE